MGQDFTREVERILSDNGCTFKSRHTANEVLQQAGLPKAF